MFTLFLKLFSISFFFFDRHIFHLSLLMERHECANVGKIYAIQCKVKDCLYVSYLFILSLKLKGYPRSNIHCFLVKKLSIL